MSAEHAWDVLDIVEGTSRASAPCARLRHNRDTGEFAIELAEGVDPADVPLMLEPFVERGQTHIDDEWARRWVCERVVPSGRQNLGQVLREAGLEFYDEYALLETTGGVSSNDDFIVRVPAAASIGQGEVAGRSPFANPDDAAAAFQRQVGRAIREARLETGLRQHELAARMGVDQAVVSRLETGRANPTASLLADAAAALGREVVFRLL